MAAAQKRQSFEERTDMNERLTNKHIRTLLHLQDVHGETERLKQRIAYLEVCEVKAKRCDFFEQELEHLKNELSKCKEIHDQAKDCQAKLQEMQKQCNAKLDQNNRQLTYRHEQEIMRLVSEKLEEENSWAIEKEKLVERIAKLERENSHLNSQNIVLENNMDKDKMSKTQIQELQSTIESYKKQNNELEEAKLALQKGIRELTRENDALRTSLESVNRKAKVLEVQAKQAKEARDEAEKNKPEPTQDLEPQVEQLQEQVKHLEKIVEGLRSDNEEKKLTIESLEFCLQDSSQSLKHLYKERDLLKNRIAGLLSEIEALKSQTSPHAEPRQSFSEYIQLKRDFTTLRDEHDKLLKKRGSKPNILPCLTADSRTVTRTFSGSSIKSRSSSNS